MSDREESLETEQIATGVLADLRADVAVRTEIRIVVHHEGGPTSVRLVQGDRVVIGRAPDPGIEIPDKSLSRRHAAFEWAEGALTVEDLGSTNGTHVNGVRLKKATTVGVHDEIIIGALRVSLSGTAAPKAPFELDSHDTLQTLVGHEVARGRCFGEPVSLLMIRTPGGDAAGWHERVRARLREVDRMGYYGGGVVEVLLPKTKSDAATEIARQIAGDDDSKTTTAVGVASFPESATSSEALVSAARDALRQATSDAPVRLADSRGTPKFETQRRPEGKIVSNKKMTALYELVDRVARSTIPVLILGETGTGKEVIARSVHDRSRRHDKPMCSVNCAAIPSQLVESTLFGHEKGAFTGAHQRKKGVFESADGGTVFLDEIGELPAQAQAALLRVLEAKQITRVGSTSAIDVDTRIVAATHRDLEQMVKDGTFREDLLYRLNVMTLTVPPLRERSDEVAALAEFFLTSANERAEREIRGLEPEALDVLERHKWPGNVRELKNAIERAVVIALMDSITVDDLPDRIRAPVRDASEEEDAPTDDQDFKTKVQTFERTMIERALDDAKWNQTEAARALRMPLRTLVYKLRSYGIERS